MKVKICGVTSVEMAEGLRSAGADMMGLMFVEGSQRHVSIEQAQSIRNAARGVVGVAAVFRNQPLELVQEVIEKVQPDYVQLHGEESPEYCDALCLPVIKAVSLQDTTEQSAEALDVYTHVCEYLLIDRRVQGIGPMVELDQVRELSSAYQLLLAGGLTPENIAEVLQVIDYSVCGVDVSGGVEDAPGHKDLNLVKSFIKTVRSNNHV